MLEGASELGDKPALIDGISGRQLTYRQLADGVKRVASALRRRGLEKGDVFAIFSPNVLEYPIAFHAVASLGGVVTKASRPPSRFRVRSHGRHPPHSG